MRSEDLREDFEYLDDQHEACSTEVFLDTSIHCARLKGPLFADRLERVLRLFSWTATSTYTKMEYGNVVLAQAQYILGKLDKFDSFDKTWDSIANVLPHKFHPAKVIWSFNLLKEHGEDDTERLERARLRLRRLMKLGVTAVETVCDGPLIDGTECYWAARGVQKRRDDQLVWDTPKCRRDNRRCRLDAFFEEHRETFVAIKAVIDEVSEAESTTQLRAFAEIIGKALDDPGMLLDYRDGCRKLADAIIAVDSLGYRSMFTQNISESDLLTRVLGQACYYLPNNPDRDVQVRSGAEAGHVNSAGAQEGQVRPARADDDGSNSSPSQRPASSSDVGDD